MSRSGGEDRASLTLDSSISINSSFSPVPVGGTVSNTRVSATLELLAYSPMDALSALRQRKR